MRSARCRSFAGLAFAVCVLAGCHATAPLPPRAVQLNDDGAAALARGELTTAEARVALALEYNPRFTEAWVNLGLIELRRGNLDQAKQDFVTARDLNPDLPTPHHALGLLADRRGLGVEAEQNYRMALKVDPGFSPARANLGRLLFARGAYDDAREQFHRLTEIAPDRVEGWVGLVESLVKLDRDPEADAALARAVERFPHAPEIAILEGRWHVRRGEYVDAVNALAPVTRDPESSRRGTAWAWIAVARVGAGDLERAVDAAEQAVAIDRDDAVASYAMAIALERRGDRERAREWQKRASDIVEGK